MDVHSPEKRSFNMSRIHGKDTCPEMTVRRWLWKNGYRYRLHQKNLPGKPDIVLTRLRVVIFIHGCFWHRHGCHETTTPESRQEFWLAKFRENTSRDKLNVEALLHDGWRIMVIWECGLRRKTSIPDLIARQISEFLNSDVHFKESGEKLEK